MSGLREQSSPTNVALGSKSRRRRNMWVEFFCSWFSHWLRGVFLRVLRFSPPLKNQHFLISSWPGIRLPKNYLVDILPLNRYFFLFFYLISLKLSLHFIVYYVLFFPPKNVSFSDVVMNNNSCHYKQVDRSWCFPSSPQSSRDVIPACSVHSLLNKCYIF